MHIYLYQSDNSSAQFVQISQIGGETALKNVTKCANWHNRNNFTAQYNAVFSMSKFTIFQFNFQNSF